MANLLLLLLLLLSQLLSLLLCTFRRHALAESCCCLADCPHLTRKSLVWSYGRSPQLNARHALSFQQMLIVFCTSSSCFRWLAKRPRIASARNSNSATDLRCGPCLTKSWYLRKPHSLICTFHAAFLFFFFFLVCFLLGFLIRLQSIKTLKAGFTSRWRSCAHSRLLCPYVPPYLNFFLATSFRFLSCCSFISLVEFVCFQL